MKLAVPSSRKARILLVTGLLLTLVAGATGILVTRLAGLPEGAALKVGDTVVTEEQLQRRADLLQALYGVEQPRDAKQLDRFRRDIAKAIAVSLILEDAARERNIVVADKTAQDMLTRLIEREFPDEGRDGFVRALGNMGASEGDVLEEIKRQLAVSRLFDEVTKGTKISEQELQRAYAERRKGLVTPEQRRLRNIVVADRKAAAEILEELRSGADFASLVRTYSLDASTRGSGGDLGLVTADQLEADYAKAAFSASPKAYFGPVRTRFGWNVGYVAEVKPGKPLTYEEVKDQLRARLEIERALRTWRSWLADEIKKADVKYADAYRPADPDSPPSAPPAGDGLSGQPTAPGASPTP